MLDPLELEFQVVVSCTVWVLGTRIGSVQRQFIFLKAELSLQSNIVSSFSGSLSLETCQFVNFFEEWVLLSVYFIISFLPLSLGLVSFFSP